MSDYNFSSNPSTPQNQLGSTSDSSNHLLLSELALLKKQNDSLIGILTSIEKEQKNSRNTMLHVKIEDLNMPFVALIGFLIKLSIASIPAAIIIMIIYFFIVLIAGGLLGGVLGAFR